MAKITYSSESQIRHPGTVLKGMFVDISSSRTLAFKLMIRDINANYRQSILGYLWAFIPPIIVSYGLLQASESNVINIKKTNLPYPAYVMLSMVLWQTFVESLNGPLQAIKESRSMLSKINFPREAIILSKMGEVLFNFGIKCFLILAIFVYYKISVPPSILFAPFGILLLILQGLSFGMFFAPLGAIIQDFSKGISIITAGWLFITPVLFAVPSEGKFSSIVAHNPVTPLLVTTREMVAVGSLSQLNLFFIHAAITIVMFFLSWVFFRLTMPYVVERMPS